MTMKGVKFVNTFCLLVAVVLALLDVSDLFSYLRDPTSFVFGTEVAGFRYVSAAHFLGSIAATIIGAVVVVAIPWLVSSVPAVVVVRVVIVAGILGLTLAPGYWG